MRIKNTHMRIKFLLLLVCFMLPFTEHAYMRMRISACVFLRLTKNKIRTQYAYFSGIYKEIFLLCDVIRLLSVIGMVLAFETFNEGSFSPKSKLLCLHKRNRLFLQSFFSDLLFRYFYKVSKTRPKILT